MSVSPPQEATHFRGKTLTPESPVPVHVPEPQNIPVLMNQIDPSFNDMSTHMESRYPPQSSNMVVPEALSEQNATTPQDATSSGQPDTQTEGAPQTGAESSDPQISNMQSESYEQAQGIESENIDTLQDNDIIQELSITNALANIANGSYAPIVTSTSDAPADMGHSQSVQDSSASIQDVTATSEDKYETPAGQDAAAPSLQPSKDSDAQSQVSTSDANGEGVNYQALLDNLSSSNSTAPAAENLNVITTAAVPPAPPSPSSAQTPIATLPVPVGLPPRPPPQEKPAIHHHYAPSEDIRTYHNPPAQVSTSQTSYSSQPSNLQPPPRNGGVAPNGMPPPPIATFQRSLANSNQKSSNSQSQQKDGPPSKTAQVREFQRDGEDEYPRRPEVEALYDAFLAEEAIYVSEGTWDRFPQGSRLFIGKLQNWPYLNDLPC